PGHNHAHNTFWLVVHLVAGWLEQDRNVALGGLHPVAETFQGVVDALDGRHDLGNQGFVFRAAAEVPVDGFKQAVLVCQQRAFEALEILFALSQRRHRVVAEGLLLLIEHPMGMLDLFFALGELDDSCYHVSLPMSRTSKVLAAGCCWWPKSGRFALGGIIRVYTLVSQGMPDGPSGHPTS